jgi:NAD+ synthetase
MGDEYRIQENYEQMFRGCVSALKSYLKRNSGLKSMVLGISGGIDSCLIAAIAFEAGKDLNIPVIGRSIPISTNKETEINRAEMVGKSFCNDFEELDKHYLNTRLEAALWLFMEVFDKELFDKNTNGDELSFDEKVRIGNIKARIRMMILFDLARKHNGIVLSTDNLTELMLGFWTLHGDVGNFGVIQNLWKTEVYGLADWSEENIYYKNFPEKAVAIRACIAGTPTDGLGITDNDLDQLLPGFKGDHRLGYREVDDILIKYLNEGGNLEHPVVKRVLATEFKRNDPYNVPRERIFWPYAP